MKGQIAQNFFPPLHMLPLDDVISIVERGAGRLTDKRDASASDYSQGSKFN